MIQPQTHFNKRIGKAQARQEFAPLVEAVDAGAGPIEITDYGRTVAVLISEKEYRLLRNLAQRNTVPQKELCGLIVIEDDLEKLSKEISLDFEKSIAKTAKDL